jgi:hypothetical protein
MIGAAGDESASSSSSSRRSEIQQLSIVVELFLQRYFSYETSFYEHILNLLLLCSFMQKIYLIFYLKATLGHLTRPHPPLHDMMDTLHYRHATIAKYKYRVTTASHAMYLLA